MRWVRYIYWSIFYGKLIEFKKKNVQVKSGSQNNGLVAIASNSQTTK